MWAHLLQSFNRQKINLSSVFAGRKVGIKQVSEEIWLVSFMDYDLGYFDHETCRLETDQIPSDPKCYVRSKPPPQRRCLAKPRAQRDVSLRR